MTYVIIQYISVYVIFSLNILLYNSRVSLTYSMLYYLRTLPITSLIVALNLVIYLLVLTGFFSPVTFLSTPGVLTTGSFLSHFSHFDFLHLLMNMVVFSQISPFLERALSPLHYVVSVLAIWLLTVFIAQPFVSVFSLGFSGILMGVIAMTALLYWRITPLRQQLLIMTLVNIAIGFLPGISFLMHFVGAVSGAIVGGVYILANIRRQ